MTVNYSKYVATVRKFSNFLRLLARWRASIYKIIWRDLLVYLAIYYSLSALYRYGLNKNGQVIFEGIVSYCQHHIAMIPLAFVLGFYVEIIIKRWWEQFLSIPWPDQTAIYVSALVTGLDERGRVMRRTIVRYVNLSLAMALRRICIPFKRRFPTLNSLVEFGLLNQNEMEIIKHLDDKWPKYPKHFMPICWAAAIATRARKENRIKDDLTYNSIIIALDNFREKSFALIQYDWMSVPLIYTQVVTLAVYLHFFALLFASQMTETQKYRWVDAYLPIFTILQYLFFMGWLRVAEVLFNPFGDDDDDYDFIKIIIRDSQLSYAMVDDMHNYHPELIEDEYWDEKIPLRLKYADESLRKPPPTQSTYKMDVRETDTSVQTYISKIFSTIKSTNAIFRRSIARRSTSIDYDTRDSQLLNLEIFEEPDKHYLTKFIVNDIVNDIINEVTVKIIVETIVKDLIDDLTSATENKRVSFSSKMNAFDALKAARAKQRQERNERRARRVAFDVIQLLPTITSNNSIQNVGSKEEMQRDANNKPNGQ